MGGFRVDFEWVWVGLELICVRCAAGLEAALGLLEGVVKRVVGQFWWFGATPQNRSETRPNT